METKEVKKNQYAFCEALCELLKAHKIDKAEIIFSQKIEDHSVTWPMQAKYEKDKLETMMSIKRTFE